MCRLISERSFDKPSISVQLSNLRARDFDPEITRRKIPLFHDHRLVASQPGSLAALEPRSLGALSLVCCTPTVGNSTYSSSQFIRLMVVLAQSRLIHENALRLVDAYFQQTQRLCPHHVLHQATTVTLP